MTLTWENLGKRAAALNVNHEFWFNDMMNRGEWWDVHVVLCEMEGRDVEE